MNAALENFSHNLIVDAIVYWPPRQKRLVRMDREIPIEGDCCVTLTFDDNTAERITIERGCFESHWNEAIAVCTSLLSLVGDLSPLSVAEVQSLEVARQQSEARQRDEVSRAALRLKQQAIHDSQELFDAGEYAQFLQQFGPDVKDLPPETEKRIAIATNWVQKKA
jgi:hypothetical protein